MIWHTSPESYKAGDTIMPGRWGRILQATGRSHPAWDREQLLERVRTGVAPGAPSRLMGAFAHANQGDALSYALPHEWVYEVGASNQAVACDMLWVTWLRESLTAGDLAKAERQAATYWCCESTREQAPHARPHWEIITSHPLVVTGVVRRPAKE